MWIKIINKEKGRQIGVLQKQGSPIYCCFRNEINNKQIR